MRFVTDLSLVSQRSPSHRLRILARTHFSHLLQKSWVGGVCGGRDLLHRLIHLPELI